MNEGDKKITLFQTAGDGIEHQQAAIFIAECSGHFVSAPLDFVEQSLDNVGSAQVSPVFFRKVIEGQAGVQAVSACQPSRPPM